MRHYIASNMHEGTREGRVYPDVWKRLPIKVTSVQRQQQIATLVSKTQIEYEKLANLPTPATLSANPTLQYRNIQVYLAQGLVSFFGEAQTAIANRPLIKEGKLILRRQPLSYLESSEPELLHYLEMYLIQLHSYLRGWTWAEARKRIDVPFPLEGLRTFMASVADITTKSQEIQNTIDRLLSEIETLVQATYREPADEEMLEVIDAIKMKKSSNGELF